jgi:hypothetical protein
MTGAIVTNETDRSQSGCSLRPGRSRQRDDAREFLVGPSFEDSSGAALLDPAPLLEKKWNSSASALVSYRHDPRLGHGTRATTTFSADDDPIHAVQANASKVL